MSETNIPGPHPNGHEGLHPGPEAAQTPEDHLRGLAEYINAQREQMSSEGETAQEYVFGSTPDGLVFSIDRVKHDAGDKRDELVLRYGQVMEIGPNGEGLIEERFPAATRNRHDEDSFSFKLGGIVIPAERKRKLGKEYPRFYDKDSNDAGQPIIPLRFSYHTASDELPADSAQGPDAPKAEVLDEAGEKFQTDKTVKGLKVWMEDKFDTRIADPYDGPVYGTNRRMELGNWNPGVSSLIEDRVDPNSGQTYYFVKSVNLPAENGMPAMTYEWQIWPQAGKSYSRNWNQYDINGWQVAPVTAMTEKDHELMRHVLLENMKIAVKYDMVKTPPQPELSKKARKLGRKILGQRPS